MYWHIFIVRYLFVLYSLSFIVCILMQLTLSVVHVLWYMRWLGKTGDLYISLVVWSNFFHRSLDDEHHIFGRSELCAREKQKAPLHNNAQAHITHMNTVFQQYDLMICTEIFHSLQLSKIMAQKQILHYNCMYLKILSGIVKMFL